MKKIAVVLFNLGGPDSRNAIEPFLFNFFMDKNIINIPIPFRCLLAKFISTRRSKREAHDSYGELGGVSPLLENSKAQGKALEEILNAGKEKEYKVFISMRYWHPMAPQTVREVRDWGADHVVILPLYPQFSTTTTWSSLQQWEKASRIADYHPKTSVICCYPVNEGFISAAAQNIAAQYKKALEDGYESPRILFSAHGLPEKVIKSGDPYKWQCEQTSGKIVEVLKTLLAREELDWQNCYQSQVGPLKWIGPSTEEELDRAAKDNVAAIIFPHAFTQEHVETLVELDIEYKEIAEKMGLHGYYRAQTVSCHKDFIAGLAEIVRERTEDAGVKAEGGETICPEDYSRCCMRSM